MTKSVEETLDDDIQYDRLGRVILPKDRFFDPWRIALSDNVKSIVSEAVLMITNYEGYYQKRKRKRKPQDQVIFEATIEAVLCDMMIAALEDDQRGTAVSLSNDVLGKRSRYRPLAYSKVLPDILERLTSREMDYIRLEKGGQNPFVNRGQRTLIWPAYRVLDRIKHANVTIHDIGRRPSSEIIILKKEKHSYWDNGEYQDYTDTEQTNQFRKELAEINDWLAQADITVDTSRLLSPRPIPTHQRRMRRIFTRGSFESGGRLFDGFWQSMKKEDRLNSIKIDGEDVIELDYGQMAPRIVYGLRRITPPSDDLYAIEGIHPNFRAGVKKLFNAMLFSEKPLPRKPKNTKALLPNDSVDVLADRILAAHPAIKDLFYCEIGHSIQYVESSIMMRLLLMLKAEGIVGLQVHDGLLVPQSKMERTKKLMEQIARELTQADIPVSYEGIEDLDDEM